MSSKDELLKLVNSIFDKLEEICEKDESLKCYKARIMSVRKAFINRMKISGKDENFWYEILRSFILGFYKALVARIGEDKAKAYFSEIISLLDTFKRR